MKKISTAFVIASFFLIAACHNQASSTSEETSEEALINSPQSEHINKKSKEANKEAGHAKTDSTTEHK